MFLAPSQSFCFQFIAESQTGAAMDATGTPVATATRNGTDDDTFTLTVTKMATGRYKVAGTVPADYVLNDMVSISVAATVDGVAKKMILAEFTVMSLNDIADATLARGVSDVAPTADKHSLCYVVLERSEFQYLKSGTKLQILTPDGDIFVTKDVVRGGVTTPIKSIESPVE